jgi:hypothetical protein
MSAKKLQNRLFGGKKEDRLDTASSNSNNRSGDASPSDDAPTPTATNPNPESIPSSQSQSNSNSDRLKINIPPPITSQLQAEQRESLQGREKERLVFASTARTASSSSHSGL